MEKDSIKNLKELEKVEKDNKKYSEKLKDCKEERGNTNDKMITSCYISTLAPQEKIILYALTEVGLKNEEIRFQEVYKKYKELLEGEKEYSTLGLRKIRMHLNLLNRFEVISGFGSDGEVRNKKISIKPRFELKEFMERWDEISRNVEVSF